MEEIRKEALMLLTALGLGASSGLIYDLLRPFRRGKGSGIFGDLIFCLICSFAMFVFAMSSNDAKTGTWELAFALLGFILYIFSFSRLFLPFLYKSLRALDTVLEINKKYIKKIKVYRKNLFKKTQK